MKRTAMGQPWRPVSGTLPSLPKLAALAFLDEAPRRVPVLVCCPLCGEPLELGRTSADFVCACSHEPESCGCHRVDFLVEGAVLTAEDLLLLGERYGVLDGRPRTVREVARARRTTRKKIRELEGRALQKWRAIAATARRTA